MSLLYFGLLGLHIAAGALIAFALIRLARRHGKSGWKFSVPIIVGSYLLVFWDVVPTAVVHTYLCRTQAGVTVYKDANAWVAEHPEEVKNIRGSAGNAQFRISDVRRGYWLSDRFYVEETVDAFPIIPARVIRQTINDGKTGTVLVERRWVSSGYLRGAENVLGEFKGWVGLEPCTKDSDTFYEQYNHYQNLAEAHK